LVTKAYNSHKLDIVEKWIDDICSNLIKPLLYFRTKKTPIICDDSIERIIIIIEIDKSFFVHKSPNGYFQRVASSKREMDTNQLARLLQEKSSTRFVHFDQLSITNALPNHLDKSLWMKFKTDLSPANDQEFLLKLRLLKKDTEGKIHPTVSGLLMACKNPEEFLNNAFIQAISYRGKDRDANYQLDAKDIVGPLDAQIKKACDFVKKNMRIYAVKEPARRDIPQYDMNAVFEAIVNAVVHRDYSLYKSKIRIHMFSDRLQICTPGTLTNSMTIESIPYIQATRN